MSADQEELYACVPEHLRHHFRVDDIFGGDALEREEIHCARRMRSAHLVASALAADAPQIAEPGAAATAKPNVSKTGQSKAKAKANTVAIAVHSAPAPVAFRLYSHAVEHAITSRMTFDRTLARLEDYFQEQASRLRRLEDTQPTVVPAWLYGGSAKLPTLLQVQRHVVQAVESCVSDSDIYLAMLEPLPSPPTSSPTPLLRFAVCSSKSSMQHRVLVSTAVGSDCVRTRESQSNQDHEREQQSHTNGYTHDSASFEAMASRRELVIEDIDTAPHKQIQRFTHDTVTGPFACFPLLGGSTERVAIGVLSLDSCRKALRLRPESMTTIELGEFLTRKHLRDAAMELRRNKFTGAQFLTITERDLNHKPMFSSLKVTTRKHLLELIHALKRGAMVHLTRPARYFIDDPDAMRFLRDVAQSTGVFLDGYRGTHWHQTMANATRDPKCTLNDVFDILVRGIARSVDCVSRVAVWRVATQPQLQIDALASTHVPDDRLMPFLQWSERLIKRVVLYKESSPSDATRLVQGTITRITISNQEPSAPATVVPSALPERRDARAVCETAQYQVSWSNRSVERYTWSQLRQLLPIREMNVKHFQLMHLIERLQQAALLAHSNTHQHHQRSMDPHSSNCSRGDGIVRLANPHGVALVIRDPGHSSTAQYVLEVDFVHSSSRSNNNNSTDDKDASATEGDEVEIPHNVIALLRRAAGITEKSVACVRGREARRMNRQLSSVRVSQTFHSMGLTPSPDALRALSEVVAQAFTEITENLPGVEVQVAELQPDGAQLRYTFAANGSTLLGKVLHRGQGVSFRCLDTKEPLVVRSDSDVASRLRRLGRDPQPDNSVGAEFPFVFLPLVHENCAIGVLSLNRFVDVPKGRSDEQQPEAGVLEYLQSMAKSLSAAIYLKRRSHALHELQSLACEPLRSPHQLFFHACLAVKDVLVGAWKVRVVEVDCARGKTSAIYELSEAERALAMSQDTQLISSLRLRVNELLDDTVARHFALEPGQIAEIHSRIVSLNEEDDEDARRIEQLDTESSARTTNSVTPSIPESEKRRLQSKRVTAKYFALLLSESSETDAARGADRLDRLSNEKYVSHALGVFLGSKTCHTGEVTALTLRNSRVFLTISSLPQFFAECERNYVARVGEILSKLMDELRQRVERSRSRVAALEAFRATCKQEAAVLERRVANTASDAGSAAGARAAKHGLSPDEELAIEAVSVLQERAIALLESVFYKPNVYIGLLEPALKRIRYTSASKGSVMRGKHLAHGHGVGFEVLKTQHACVVTQSDVQQALSTTAAERDDSHDNSNNSSRGCDGAMIDSAVRRLRFFTSEPAKQKWPFIAVPIGALGVLSLDNLERYERVTCEPQPEIGVVDFLRRIASEMHSVIETVRTASLSARQTRRAQALTRIMAACDDVKSRTPAYLQTLVVHEIEGALNGVDAYIGIVEPLCECIRFTCASSRSGMEHQRADTVNSASFRVFATQRPLVIPQLRTYLCKQDDTTVVSNGKLKVLRSASSSSSLSYEPTGPFVCVPIPFVGVLTVDTFPGAAGGMYSPRFPEKGVIEFLSRVANLVGENMRTRSALVAAQRIPEVFQGTKSTFKVVFHELLLLLTSNMVAVEEMHVLRFSRGSSQEPMAPLASRKRARMEASTIDMSAIAQRVCQHMDELEAADAFDDSNGAATPCIALPDSPEVLLAVLEPTRDVTHDNGAFASTALVLRRVCGATWMYDLELLRSLVPLVNDVVAQVNVRVDGIVTRRRALLSIDAISQRLDGLPAHDAILALRDCVRDALEHIASGLSRSAGCDVYLGERQVGGDSLVFTCASRESRVENVAIDLTDDANASLVCVQCLEHQQPSVVHLFDARNDKLLRPLSDKKCVRVHVVVPVGDDRILCADSLGMDAFQPATRRLESDVLQFFTACAAKLNELILTTHYRRSYDDLVRLKAPTQRHANFRRFFATLLQIVRRDLVVVHSQQILTLASDFTGLYHTEAWHAAPTRRALASGGTLMRHMCYQNQCEPHLIPLGVHFEGSVQLPMTNLPRTLDASRSSLEPAHGFEKRGTFACACLATMLDAHLIAPRVALCVYTHDAKTRARAPTAFSASQRQFFFALAAVAADVFTHMYRICALHSIADELFFSLHEQLSAKDGLAVRVQQRASGGSEAQASTACCVVLCSSQETKFPRRSVLQESLSSKVLQFVQSTTDFAVFVRKKPDVSPLLGTASPPPSQTAAGASETPLARGAATESKSQAKAPSHSFFKRPGNLFRSRKADATPSPPAVRQQQEHTAAATTHNRDELLQNQPQYRFHVLVRGVPVFGEAHVFSFDIERHGMDSAKALEQIAKRWRESALAIIDAFMKRAPRGDEEMLRYVLGPDARSDAYHVSAGGGYYLLAHLEQSRQCFQQQSLRLETDIRGFLTGVQPTARDAMLSGRVPPTAAAGALDVRGTQLPSSLEPVSSVFAEDGDHDAAQVASAAVTLLEVSMTLVGYKKDALAKMDKHALLKEFLRANVVKKLVNADPRDRKQWGSVLRAKALLVQVHDKISVLQMLPLLSASPQHATQHSTQHGAAGSTGHGVHAAHARLTVAESSSAATALCAMSTLLAAIVAVVRYEKQLEADAARERLRVDRSATVLQCFVRALHAKATLKQLRKEFVAARAIQCAFRQHLARRRVLFLKWVRAATKIQRAYRLKLLRRKGSQPKRLSDELLAISKKFGGLGASQSVTQQQGVDEIDGDSAWRVEMDAFETFPKYIASHAGKEQLKREESVMTKRMRELMKEREKLPPEQRIVEDVKDLFELMDTDGGGELSRDAMREMMVRLRIPLAKEEVDDVIDMMDSDRSGEISLSEFTHWFFHEYPVLKKRSRDCGVVSRKDWQWVIERSAREALRKRYRALRLGRQAPSRSGDRGEFGAAEITDDGVTRNEADDERQQEEQELAEVQQHQDVEARGSHDSE